MTISMMIAMMIASVWFDPDYKESIMVWTVAGSAVSRVFSELSVVAEAESLRHCIGSALHV